MLDMLNQLLIYWHHRVTRVTVTSAEQVRAPPPLWYC